jgi:hypothetical protein
MTELRRLNYDGESVKVPSVHGVLNKAWIIPEHPTYHTVACRRQQPTGERRRPFALPRIFPGGQNLMPLSYLKVILGHLIPHQSLALTSRAAIYPLIGWTESLAKPILLVVFRTVIELTQKRKTNQVKLKVTQVN